MCEGMSCPHYEGINMMPPLQGGGQAPRFVNGPADRIGIQRDEFLDSRVAVFIVTLPKGLSPEEATVFKREVAASLEAICKDAELAVDSERAKS